MSTQNLAPVVIENNGKERRIITYRTGGKDKLTGLIATAEVVIGSKLDIDIDSDDVPSPIVEVDRETWALIVKDQTAHGHLMALKASRTIRIDGA